MILGCATSRANVSLPWSCSTSTATACPPG